jgi:hypothetical protein
MHRRGAATALAAALLVPAFVAWSLARFYATPTIFAYDPFYGFFPGAIYDERRPPRRDARDLPRGHPRLDHRRRRCCSSAPGATRRSRARGRSRSRAPRWARGGRRACGSRGPRSVTATRRGTSPAALEREAWSGAAWCAYDRSIDARQARLTARDCDVRVAQLEAFYGVRVPRRVTVFLFAERVAEAGADGRGGHVHREALAREVYLQYAAFPHPVLKHELAHVVAGAMAPGPFQVTARGRCCPVPGLIEGAAVAAAWEGDGDATPHQWSRAMLEAGMAPRWRASKP